MTLSLLSFFLEQLPAERFLRIYSSYVVARWHIKEVRGSEIVCSNRKLPVGKTYRSSISKIKLLVDGPRTASVTPVRRGAPLRPGDS